MEIIAFILFTTFGVISLIESRKEDEKLNNLIELTKKELNNSENDYSLMVDELETDIESNKELLFPSILRSNSISTDSNNNELNFGLILGIFFA